MSNIFGILFYSNKCKHSNNLRLLMHNNDLLKFFTEKCIDNMNVDELTEYNLSTVPTLVVIQRNVNNSVQNKNIFEAEAAFNWVQSIIINRRDNIIKSAENSRKLIQLNNAKNNENSFRDHDPLESGGVSDNYAYWTNDVNKDIDLPQPKSFLPFGKEDDYKIIAFNNPFEKDKKINDYEQLNKTNDIKKIRETQDNAYKKQYGENHLNAVIKTQIGI
jgi:hypothetical protein